MQPIAMRRERPRSMTNRNNKNRNNRHPGTHIQPPLRQLPAYALPVLFTAALFLRLVHIWQIRDLGFFDTPLSDAAVFVNRAHEIAAGQWLGPPDFVHAPLYAYLLGLGELILGWGWWWPRVAQAIGGATACVLLALLGTRLFNRRTGLLAGAMLALFPPAIFFDALIQKTSLALLLSVLLLWSLVEADTRRSLLRWALAGALLGLLILTRQNALLLLPLLPAWIWWAPNPGNRRQCATATLVSLAACALILTPWALRNRAVTGEWVLTTPNLGQNFAMGNHPQATGTYLPHKRGRSNAQEEQAAWVREAQHATGRNLSPREVSNYYLKASLRWLAENPAAGLALLAKKIVMTWGAYEAPDTEDYYLYRERAPLLNALDKPWHFGVLAPLAAIGLLASRNQRRKLWLLYAWVAVITIAVAAFVVFARYRIPLVPVLALFAAAGGLSTANALRSRRWRRLAGFTLLGALVALTANWPIHRDRRPYPMAYINHAIALADGGRLNDARAELDKALKLRPNDVDARTTRASVLLELNHLTKAQNDFKRALAGDPDYTDAMRGLANTYAAQGQYQQAENWYRKALRAEPQDHRTRTSLAATLAQTGNPDQALALLRDVIKDKPDYPDAYLNLGNTLLSLRRITEAENAYRNALNRKPDYADAWHNLGVCQALSGRLEPAVQSFHAALDANPRHQAARNSLLRALERLGRRDEANALRQRWQADARRSQDNDP